MKGTKIILNAAPLLAICLSSCDFSGGECGKHHDDDDAKQERTITVTGMAELQVHPDEAAIAFTFSSTGRKMAAAHEATTKKVDAFVAKLAPLGIAKEQTNLGDVSYAPNYTYPESSPQKVVSYTAKVDLTVKTKRFADIPLVLDAGVDAGVDAVGSVSFSSTKIPEHKKQVRDMAIKATKDKARQLAEGLGAKLGPVRTISESAWDSSVSPWSPYGYGRWQMSNAVQQSSATTPASPELSELGQLTPGSIPLTLNLTATFLLE